MIAERRYIFVAKFGLCEYFGDPLPATTDNFAHLLTYSGLYWASAYHRQWRVEIDRYKDEIVAYFALVDLRLTADELINLKQFLSVG